MHSGIGGGRGGTDKALNDSSSLQSVRTNLFPESYDF